MKVDASPTSVPSGSSINDISNASTFFKAMLYADDSTLITALDISDISSFNVIINYELSKISNWLNLNMLSINVSKSKFTVFHMPQKRFNILSLNINDTDIDLIDRTGYRS